VLVAALVALPGCDLADRVSPSTRGLAASDVTIASRILERGERDVAPKLRGETIDGEQFDVAALRGYVVVVNYWGSWCAPCRAETPELVALARETEHQGVRFVGVDIRDERANAQAFARRYRVPYPSLFDPDGQTAIEFGPMAPRAVPSTYVLDTGGRVAAFAYGRVTSRALQAMINTVRDPETPTGDPT
jgi:peroxiredoxin